MNKSTNLSGQLTKVLDTNTPRKQGLKNFYMMTVETSKLLMIPEEKRSAVFGNMLEVTKKLAKVADAVDEYYKQEKLEIKRITREVKKHDNPELILAEESSKLEAIVEEVLSQGKSALDVGVKILNPLLGIKLNTFGQGGSSVVKALRCNIPEEFQTRSQYLIDMIENEGDWINVLKRYRDDQHYKNLGISAIRANGKGESEAPLMPDGQPVSQVLAIIYENLFTFLMDFMALSMLIKLPPAIGLVPEGEGLNKKVRLGIINLPTVN